MTYEKEAKRKQIREPNTPISLEKRSGTSSLTLSDEETNFSLERAKNNIRLNFLKN